MHPDRASVQAEVALLQLVGAQGGGYGMPTAGGSYAVSFPTAGTYTYHCANHAQMTGTVTVVP